MQDSQSPSNVLSGLAVVATDRVRQPPLRNAKWSIFSINFATDLFRYVLTFGLPIEDCEEVIQETFLALFQHLTRGQIAAGICEAGCSASPTTWL